MMRSTTATWWPLPSLPISGLAQDSSWAEIGDPKRDREAPSSWTASDTAAATLTTAELAYG
jgi:hypothetical protein